MKEEKKKSLHFGRSHSLDSFSYISDSEIRRSARATEVHQNEGRAVNVTWHTFGLWAPDGT